MNANHATIRDAFGQYLAGPVEHSGACPDCDATLSAAEPYPGVFVLHVAHDATCPTLAAIRRSR